MTIETVIAKDKGRNVQLTYIKQDNTVYLVHGSKVYQCIIKDTENPLFQSLCGHHFLSYDCGNCNGYDKNKDCYLNDTK